MIRPISSADAEHYTWGDACDGWHLLRSPDLSVVQERVPAGAGEVMHFHKLSCQFFYILEGEGTIALEQQSRCTKDMALRSRPVYCTVSVIALSRMWSSW